MSTSPFTEGLGATSGRVADGLSYAFVLGSATPGTYRTLVTNDYIEIEQEIDVTATGAVGVPMRVVAPTTLPGGTSFLLRISMIEVGGADFGFWETTITAGADRDYTDAAVFSDPFSASIRRLRFRLEFQAGDANEYNVELPGVFLANLYEEGIAPIELLTHNRVPAPGTTGAPAATTISLDLFDVSGNGIDIPSVQVFVNGALAFSGGAFEPGWDGPDSATSVLVWAGLGYRITIDPTVPFGSEEVVEVELRNTSLGLGLPYTWLWSFTVADTAQPVVVDAFATAHKTLRVRFNEDIETVISTNFSLALASSTLDDGLPAVTLQVVDAVFGESSDIALLTTDIEMTPGALYTVTVTGVTDLRGNAIGSPNTATFAGYACPVPEDRDFELWEMIPELNRSEDGERELEAFIACLQEPLDLVFCLIDRWAELLDPDTIPEAALDLALADVGNPFAFDLTAVEKRRLLRLLVAVYRAKGTASGIIDAIRLFLGIEVTVTYPWTDGAWILGYSTLGFDTVASSSDPADRYTYVVTSPLYLTSDQRTKLTSIARYMQVAHEHLRLVEPDPPAPVPDHWALGASHLGSESLLH